MRSAYTHEEKEAARILDMVTMGIEVPDMAILWALMTLGDIERW